MHIVTSRIIETSAVLDEVPHPTGQPRVGTFLKKHLGDVLSDIAGVHFTSGKLKWKKLVELGSEKHFDDDPCELEALPICIKGVRVPTLHGFE